jgi:hypothetical protein
MNLLKKAKLIVEGWRNHLIPPEELKSLIEAVSAERLGICSQCPYQSENAKKHGYTTYRADVHCTVCKCPLITKTKSLSSECPNKFWDAITTNEEKLKIEQEIQQHETDKLQEGHD